MFMVIKQTNNCHCLRSFINEMLFSPQFAKFQFDTSCNSTLILIRIRELITFKIVENDKKIPFMNTKSQIISTGDFSKLYILKYIKMKKDMCSKVKFKLIFFSSFEIRWIKIINC